MIRKAVLAGSLCLLLGGHALAQEQPKETPQDSPQVLQEKKDRLRALGLDDSDYYARQHTLEEITNMEKIRREELKHAEERKQPCAAGTLDEMTSDSAACRYLAASEKTLIEQALKQEFEGKIVFVPAKKQAYLLEIDRNNKNLKDLLKNKVVIYSFTRHEETPKSVRDDAEVYTDFDRDDPYLDDYAYRLSAFERQVPLRIDIERVIYDYYDCMRTNQNAEVSFRQVNYVGKTYTIIDVMVLPRLRNDVWDIIKGLNGEEQKNIQEEKRGSEKYYGAYRDVMHNDIHRVMDEYSYFNDRYLVIDHQPDARAFFIYFNRRSQDISLSLISTGKAEEDLKDKK